MPSDVEKPQEDAAEKAARRAVGEWRKKIMVIRGVLRSAAPSDADLTAFIREREAAAYREGFREGAEAMRSTTAFLAWRWGGPDGETIAKAIRALPLPEPKEER